MIIKKKIGAIEFSLLSPQLIRKISGMEITVSELYDQDGFPVEGGLMDPKMGIVDPGLRCRTCGARIGECPGHFGYIELARPVIHVKFAETIYKLLNATCSECGRVKMEEDVRAKLKRTFSKVSEERGEMEKWRSVLDSLKYAIKKSSCPHCNTKSPEIRYEKPTTFYKDKERMTPIDIRDWFEKIPNEDLPFLGMNPEVARPEWMIVTAFSVPPVTVRPSITLETGERAEDDLTHKLVDIMRINMRLKENMGAGAPAVIIEDLWELLQYHVTTFIDNEIAGIPPSRHRAGRVLKGLAQRIKSKEGRFRYNLAGKRVNFSARTVISPDSKLGINEVGIPIEVAKELTVPEVVTERNIEDLKSLVLKGSEGLEGVNYVLMPDGRRKKVTEDVKETIAEDLKPGMIVERHLTDGDIVLFNRQPSLHRLSIMAHRAKILPYHSFRMNPAVCPPYNADFDGDEMNLHVPQTYEARVEAEILMNIQKNIITPRYGGPIIGGHQDHVTGLYLLTREGTELSKEDAAQLLFEAGIDAKIKGEKISGKEIFSLILPNITTNFDSRASKTLHGGKKSESTVIKKGKLVQGVIDAAAMGSGGGVLIDLIYRKFGDERARQFIDEFTRLGLTYLRNFGFSVGLDDFAISKSAKDAVSNVLDEGEKEAMRQIESFRLGKLDAWPGMTKRQTLEMEIMSALNGSRDKAVEIVKDFVEPENPAVIMAACGARGKILNVAQMSACLGQQAIGGGRVRRGYEDRTLPHFKLGDIGARSKGFIRSSYGSGLDPFEFFWVAMAGREGLTDTSMRTPKSGYMYRRLSNALQDLYVAYDRSVRDNRGKIVQFTYGEDGVDPTKSDRGKVSFKRVKEDMENE